MSVYRFCKEWTDGVAQPDTIGARRWKSVNVFYSGRTIYSYGTHFVMGYVVAPNVVWLNGRRVSNTTSRHQSELRRALSHKPDCKVIIVPEDALTAAGIDYRTIEPVDVHPDGTEYIRHGGTVAPSGMVPIDTVNGYYRYGSWHGTRGADIADKYSNAVGALASDELVMFDGAQYRWHTSRHWLGDSVFTAQQATYTGTVASDAPRTYWVSSFDRQERRPLYFLSQLPGRADTLDEAIELLAPESVKTARDMGRDVKRQGDMFAIPMDVTTRALKAMGATFERRKVETGLVGHARRDVAIRDAVLAVLETMPERVARPYWNSRTESRETFDAVLTWWRERGEEYSAEVVRRYAERFPNYPELSPWGWESAARYKPSVWHKTRDVTGTPLLGTAHTATEVATLPDGSQYARGMLYHEPSIIGESRRADHARRTLGKQWHLIARNTVPVVANRRAVA